MRRLLPKIEGFGWISGTFLIKAISSHILHPPTFKKCFKWKRVSITWTLRSWCGHVATACWSSRIQKFVCHSNSSCAASFWFMLKSECCNEDFVNSFATSICATNFRTVWILLIFALKIILLLFLACIRTMKSKHSFRNIVSSKSMKKFLVEIEVYINVHIALDKVHLGSVWMCIWLCCTLPFSKNDQMEHILV